MVSGEEKPAKFELAVPWQRAEAAFESDVDGHVTQNDLAASNLHGLVVGDSELATWRQAQLLGYFGVQTDQQRLE